VVVLAAGDVEQYLLVIDEDVDGFAFGGGWKCLNLLVDFF
jgi:hypothetical protein